MEARIPKLGRLSSVVFEYVGQVLVETDLRIEKCPQGVMIFLPLLQVSFVEPA